MIADTSPVPAKAPQPSAHASSRRARLFLLLSTVLFIAWIGAMIAMYVLTVYPQRYPSTQRLDSTQRSNSSSLTGSSPR
jgi:hypothetical protein